MAFQDLVTEMHDLIDSMVEGIDGLYTALIYSNVKVMADVEASIQHVRERMPALTESLIEGEKDTDLAMKYAGLPSHIERIGENLGRIAQAIKGKIAENILFSDKAISELEYLFGRVRDMMANTKDMILARNTLVARHLEESEKALESTANVYATLHEERLIEGLCMPRASSLYLEMIESFKGIAWHCKEIARTLVR
ncbi:MAG: hypothetical protein P8Y39_03005 [Nitrospirota bacterium]|jgi:Na+/phosphate symporter